VFIGGSFILKLNSAEEELWSLRLFIAYCIAYRLEEKVQSQSHWKELSENLLGMKFSLLVQKLLRF